MVPKRGILSGLSFVIKSGSRHFFITFLNDPLDTLRICKNRVIFYAGDLDCNFLPEFFSR